MKHAALVELLPWYANGTLGGRERRLVEDHLGKCSSCARELEQLGVLSALATEIAAASPDPSMAPLDRALDSIDAIDPERVYRPSLLVTPFWQKMVDWWASWWQPMPTLARAVVVVQAFLLVVAIGLLGSVWRSTDSLVTAGATRPPAEENRVRLLLGFQETASAADVAATIRSLGGTIVAGPSSIGLYTVEIPRPSAGVSELDALVVSLREQRGILSFVEVER